MISTQDRLTISYTQNELKAVIAIAIIGVTGTLFLVKQPALGDLIACTLTSLGLIATLYVAYSETNLEKIQLYFLRGAFPITLYIHIIFFNHADELSAQLAVFVALSSYPLLFFKSSHLRVYYPVQILLMSINLFFNGLAYNTATIFFFFFLITSGLFGLGLGGLLKQKAILVNLKREQQDMIVRYKDQQATIYRYKNLFEVSIDMICIADYNGYFIEVNPSFSRVLGYTKEELNQSPFVDFVHPDDVDRTLAEAVKLAESDAKTLNFINRYRTKWGTYRYFQWNASPDHDKQRLYCVVKDITAEREAAQKLFESEQHLKAIFEQNSIGICTSQLDTKFLSANPKFLEMLGYSLAELNSCTGISLTHPEDVELTEQKLAEVRAGADASISYEKRMLHKNGKIIWMRINVTGLRDEQGELDNFLTTMEDITEEKAIYQSLVESQKYLREAQKAAKIGHWSLDFPEMKINWSEETYRIHEVDPETFTPELESGIAFYAEDSIPLISQAVGDCIEHGKSFDLKLGFITAKKNKLWVRAIGQPEYNEDHELVKVFGVFQDVTEQHQNEIKLIKAKEKAEAGIKAKADFLSNMSHEIRTPLNAVVGTAYLLLESPRPDQVELLNTLRFSSENLLSLVNDVLDYSKIDAGKVNLEYTDVNLYSFLESVYKGHKMRVQEKQISLALDIEQHLKLGIKGDSIRLGQVLNNLLSNAIKFTEQGGVTLKVSEVESQTKRSPKHKTIRFEIIDTGIGIPEEKRALIFESFIQAGTDTTRKYGGTGLGLAITKALLQLMGSKIELESQAGKGSTFAFTLELETFEIETNNPVNGIGTLAPNEYKLANARILLVEDNKVNIMIASRFLKKWGANLTVAKDGLEALEKTNKDHYDLILMDIRMPNMNGWEATKKIRETDEATPIIALSASAEEELQKETTNHGMNDFISKPFEPQKLYTTIKKHIH